MDKYDLDEITLESDKKWKNIFGKFNISFRKSKINTNLYINENDDKQNTNDRFSKRFNKSFRESKWKTKDYFTSLKCNKEIEEKNKQFSCEKPESCKETNSMNYNPCFQRTSQNRFYSSMYNRKCTTALVQNSKYLFGSQEISPKTKLAQYDVNMELMNKFRRLEIRELEKEPVKRIKESRTSEKCIQTSLIEEQTTSNEEMKDVTSEPSPSSQYSSGYVSEVTNLLSSPNSLGTPEVVEKNNESFLSKSRLKENSVWVYIDDSDLLSEEFVRQLHKRFRIKGNKAMSSDKLEIDCGNTVTSLFNTLGSKTNQDPQLSVHSSTNMSIRRSMRFGSQSLASRTQTLDLLPVKAAQSIAIAMASAHLNPEDVARSIIELKTTVNLRRSKSFPNENTKHKSEDKSSFLTSTTLFQPIPDTLLDTLINFIPPMDIILKLSESQLETSNLIEAEKLLYMISQLRHRLPAHLHALRMLIQFDTTVDQLKQALSSACKCLSEIRHSNSLCHVLSCALALVNALNATRQCSVYESSQLPSDHSGLTASQGFVKRKPFLGFEVRNLVRLADTRDITNQRNLIHYLVELMELNFTKEAHSWFNEMPTLDAAQSLYCAKTIEEKLVETKRDVARLEIDLRGVGGVANSNNAEWVIKSNSDPKSDAFKANLSFGLVVGQFLAHAMQELKLLSELHKTFTERYNEVANYLALDQAKYTADELFNDLKTFRELYRKACTSK
ncbi:formin-related [Schistosoma mansoni]|uniref:formin-related n=1 Tax=Schistosoma mansoni TaxID=6183 RepID=UPI0001A63925|nr:formin-related [Schistosoma mansoni]|eukprot:XP_018654991.1 formin-related [Schistosoma mansoni]